MELKFEELEGSEVDNSNNINYSNYWNTNNQSIKTNEKKTKVSYDDILSSLNMVVNNGVLQFAKPINKPQQTNQTQSNSGSMSIQCYSGCGNYSYIRN